jgi:hypothetical protein
VIGKELNTDEKGEKADDHRYIFTIISDATSPSRRKLTNPETNGDRDKDLPISI